MQIQPIISQKLKSLPSSPGVYIFKDKNGGILYVGKAGSLKDRVSSYFQGVGIADLRSDNGRNAYMRSLRANRPIEMFISEVADLEIRKTDTVLEAYILEQELIKKLQPKYNMMSKDDKSFCYVVVTKEEWPRFVVMRKTDLNKELSPFGKGGLNASKRSIQGGFEKQIKSTNPSVLRTPASPAGRSPFAKGRRVKFTKIYGPYIARHQIETALKILRRIFPYHSRKEKTEKGCLDYQIGLCPGPYDNAISKEDYQKNIRSIRMILEGKKKSLINKMKKEMEEYSLKLDYESATKIRNQIFALQHIQDVALISDYKNHSLTLPLKKGENKTSPFEKGGMRGIYRIEGYDISNISGKWATGSMVVFDNSENVKTQDVASLRPNKNQYRKFRIKTIEGANDVGAMEEVLTRRFRNNWTKPNLIILDGGKGHLNMARKILRNFHLEIPIIAVAKGSTRKKLDVYSFGTIPQIPKNVIEQVRDEAHRFAIKYHKKLRKKSLLDQAALQRRKIAL
jgi:excinuclease ABC subunit C